MNPEEKNLRDLVQQITAPELHDKFVDAVESALKEAFTIGKDQGESEGYDSEFEDGQAEKGEDDE